MTGPLIDGARGWVSSTRRIAPRRTPAASSDAEGFRLHAKQVLAGGQRLSDALHVHLLLLEQERDRVERQIASVAALVATGRSSQLPVHLRSSLKAGLTPQELQEVIIQTATIAGFPPAMNAWSTLKTIVAETEG